MGMGWGDKMGKRKGACSQSSPLCLPVPWHSQAVAEILHERVQAGEGEDRQNGKRQLKGEEDEDITSCQSGVFGGR